ncbi:serine/threonine protein kinase, partial [Myxococcota bacterium]|nr:serine/threonine protein kinase [Myxococcota bacterium]
MAFEQDPFGAGEPGRPPTSEGRPIARKFGRYTLVHRLATGGMAEIWLATHRGVADFVRFVVVKKILSHLSDQPSFVELFLQEARTCALLNHPNIVQIYDLGREGTSYFIAMEYIAGEDLASITKRAAELGQPVPPTFAAKILADASKALHYAHGLTGPDGQPLGIVHRDVSPQNVLVTYEGEVKVVDFGIAKAASEEPGQPGVLTGKFSYMSPEQARGRPLDARSDIFSLGIVLWELVTGKRLFKHDSELMILDLVTKLPVPRPVEVGTPVAPDLESVIFQALDRDATMRYQTAAELQVALEAVVRRAPKAVTSADRSAWMKGLYARDEAAKRALCESAARGERQVLSDVPTRAPSGVHAALGSGRPAPARGSSGVH